MRPEDLDLLVEAGGPALTPDGRHVVVSVVRPDLDSDTYTGGLWVVPVEGGPARRLTNGHHDRAATVSPDGERVAFLRAGKDAPPQVHVTGLAGGEPVALTDHPLGAGAPSWSPDGSRLAYTARVPEPGRYGTEDAEGRKPGSGSEPPRLITTPAYRVDDLGFTRDRRAHLFVLDVPPGPTDAGEDLASTPVVPRQLTSGDVDDANPVWSPDGSTLAFVSRRHATRETDLRSGVYAVASAAASPVEELTTVLEHDGGVSALQWLPDRRLVLVVEALGPDGMDFVGRPSVLWVTEEPVADRPVTLRRLTLDEADLDAGGATDLVVAGGRVLVREQRRGAVRLLSVDPSAGAGADVVVVDGHLVVTGHTATADGSTVAVTASTPERPGDLAVVRDGELQWLTDTGRRLRESGVRPMRELTATSGDGHPVHGWALLPDPEVHGEGPYPVLLTIHGGPFTQYDWGVFDESQVYVGAGYAVVRCNPRGSSGYGTEHGRSIKGAMGSVDADDVIAFLDHVLAEESLPLDSERVGVMGGSYGGYMTALLTTRTDRFRAAIVERGYLDASSFIGSSDIGWLFPDQYHGSPEAMVAQSPMSAVGQVSTPTLVIHSEEDWRCPVEQGQRWYTALRRQGVPTELLLFPGEGHELTRSGNPRHRRQRFDHVLRWWSERL